MKMVKFDDHEFSKASFSQYRIQDDKCVQIARRPDAVGVRDSKDMEKTTLCFTIEEWRAFIAGVKAGEFDA